jgi:hypothetical protein
MLTHTQPNHLLHYPPSQFLNDMLRGICLEIQPLDSMIERFEKSYQIIESILRNAPEGSIIHKIDLRVFVQGSLLTDTVVKPIHQDELDLDVVILFELNHNEVEPRAIQDEIFNLLKADERYRDKVERKSRCVTIQYKTNFHIDLMPALPEFMGYENDSILVPHKKGPNLYFWQSSNPVGINKWLIEIENRYHLDSIQKSIKLAEASIEVSPFPAPKKYKSNLRYIIQLLKRARDHYFKDDEEVKKIARSIALLVLAGTHYKPSGGSLLSELLHVVSKIDEATSNYMNLHVYNPLHSDRDNCQKEDFAEKWRQNKDLYQKFREWIVALKSELEEIYSLRDKSYNEYVDKLKKIFNATPVETLLNQYGEKVKLAQNSGKASINSSGTLLFGAGAGASIPAPKAQSFGDERKEKYFRCERVQGKLPLYAHVEKMRRDFPQFKMSYVKGERDTVRWIGEVQPELFGDKYTISISYKDGYHPIVKVLSHDVGKYSKHLYPQNKLCLYHPYEGEGRWRMNEPISSKIIPLTVLWLIQWEIYRKTGKWNGDEFPHGDPSQLEGAA